MKRPMKVDASKAAAILDHEYETVVRQIERANNAISRKMSGSKPPYPTVRVGHSNGEECLVVDHFVGGGVMTFTLKDSVYLDNIADCLGALRQYDYYSGFYDAYKALFGFARRDNGHHEVTTYDGE